MQKGRDTGGDMVKAMKAEAYVSAGIIDEASASNFEQLEATLDFVDTVSAAKELGIDMTSQLSNLGSISVEELNARSELTTSQNELVKGGVLTVADAKSRADNSANLSSSELKQQAESNSNLKLQIDQGLSPEEAKQIAENETAASESPELLALMNQLQALNLSSQELSVVLEDLFLT
jgi:hypothetical protein